MNSKPPKVSVVMPVYNGGKYLREAIDSILAQTFTDFEFIIVDDGSHDLSVEIVRSIADPRIRLVCNKSNLGVAQSRNRGIRLAQGTYIANMDADDVSRPERLARQAAFLDTYPQYGVVGSWAEIWHEYEKTERVHRHPAESLILKYEILFDSYFVNSSTMIRKSVFETIGLYSTDVVQPNPGDYTDYVLWSSLAQHFEMANLPEYLLVYREVQGSQSRQNVVAFRNRVIDICAGNLAYAIGKPHPDQVITDLAMFVHEAYVGIPSPIHIVKWIYLLFKVADRLSSANHSPYTLLRRLAYKYTKRILQTYSRQLVSALKHKFVHLIGYVRRD